MQTLIRNGGRMVTAQCHEDGIIKGLYANGEAVDSGSVEILHLLECNGGWVRFQCYLARRSEGFKTLNGHEDSGNSRGSHQRRSATAKVNGIDLRF